MSALREAAEGARQQVVNFTIPHNLRDSKILLVDDVEFNLILLTEMFRKAGFTCIHKASNGTEALKLTEDLLPDIVILDLIMPIMDGYAYLAAIRKNPVFADLPILVQTASSTAKDKRRVFRAGASDFVSKPVESFELLSRAIVHLQQRKILIDLRIAQQRINEEIEQARRMQSGLLPDMTDISKLEETYPLRIVSLFRFSSELGGDMWGADVIDDHRCSVYAADFSGHGVAAALNTFRLDTVAYECRMHADDPGRYVSALNNRLHRLLPPEQFATLFYAVVDTEKEQITYTCAAPPKPFIVRANGAIDYIDNAGFPIAVLSDASYVSSTVVFSPGDTLFLYSDALIETPLDTNDAESCYDETDVAEQISELRQQYDDDTMFADAVHHFCRLTYSKICDDLGDDLTVLAFIFRR